jgi:sugar phosphate isomerase/epimerase
MRCHRLFVVELFLIGVVDCLIPGSLWADGLPNPFFVMDTAFIDAPFRQPHLTRNQQLDLVKEFGFAGITWTEGVPWQEGVPAPPIASWKGGACWMEHEPEQMKAAVADLEKRGLKLFAHYCHPKVTVKGDLIYSPYLPAVMKAMKGHGTIVWLDILGEGPNYGDGPAFDTLTGREPVILKLRFLAETAKANGLKIAFYPHTARWAARFGDATKLAKVVDHPNCGVCFNLCHCLCTGDEEKIPALLEEARSVLFLVTINGVDSCRNGPVPISRFVQRLDQGTFDVGTVLRKLREIGYTGPIGFQGHALAGDVRSILASTMEAWKKLSAIPR